MSLAAAKKDVAGAGEVLGPHIVHIHPPEADLVPHLVPQVAVRREQVQGGQQRPADAFGPHGGPPSQRFADGGHLDKPWGIFLSFLFLRPALPGCGQLLGRLYIGLGAGVRWTPLAPVSAAASVGARRSPLGSNTRAGRRDQGVWAEQRREKRRSKNRQDTLQCLPVFLEQRHSSSLETRAAHQEKQPSPRPFPQKVGSKPQRCGRIYKRTAKAQRDLFRGSGGRLHCVPATPRRNCLGV